MRPRHERRDNPAIRTCNDFIVYRAKIVTGPRASRRLHLDDRHNGVPKGLLTLISYAGESCQGLVRINKARTHVETDSEEPLIANEATITCRLAALEVRCQAYQGRLKIVSCKGRINACSPLQV